MPTDPPRCGDHVLHRPTGEEWVVAYADAERDELAWCGWPEGHAKLSDCTLVMRCTDEVHREWVQRFVDSRHDSHRKRRVMELYGEVTRGLTSRPWAARWWR